MSAHHDIGLPRSTTTSSSVDSRFSHRDPTDTSTVTAASSHTEELEIYDADNSPITADNILTKIRASHTLLSSPRQIYEPGIDSSLMRIQEWNSWLETISAPQGRVLEQILARHREIYDEYFNLANELERVETGATRHVLQEIENEMWTVVGRMKEGPIRTAWTELRRRAEDMLDIYGEWRDYE